MHAMANTALRKGAEAWPNGSMESRGLSMQHWRGCGYGARETKPLPKMAVNLPDSFRPESSQAVGTKIDRS